MGLKHTSGHFPPNSAGGPSPGPSSKYELGLQFFAAKMPKNDSQIKHIMRTDRGHLSDTPTNRKILVRVANNEKNFIGIDSHGNRRYAQTIRGVQYWVSTRNGIIQNGGKNTKPFKKFFDKHGGYKK